jgi:hypothetical protein
MFCFGSLKIFLGYCNLLDAARNMRTYFGNDRYRRLIEC